MTDFDDLIAKSKTEDTTVETAAVREAITTWLEAHDAIVHPEARLGQTFQATIDADTNHDTPDDSTVQSPDVLVTINETVIAVTVTTGTSYSDLADAAHDVFTQWSAYHTDNVWHDGPDRSRDPDLFALATLYSPYGHLHRNDHEFIFPWHETNPTLAGLPQHEGNLSAATLRLLWRFAKNHDHTELKAGLGSILSDSLDEFDNFDATADTHNMCRSSDIEATGRPAALYWDGDQHWDQPRTPHRHRA